MNIQTKQRNPFIAFFLSLISPGIGQIYTGQLKKGVLFFGITFILPFVFGLTRLGIFFEGFVSIIIIDYSFRIYAIYDAVKNARNQKKYNLKPYNTWYYHLLIVVIVLSIKWFYDYNSILGIKSFDTSSTANEPTLKMGDKFVADLNAFKNQSPNYGDIVIFQKKDSLNSWLFRIVALPNDKIEIENNFLKINGKKCPTTYIKEAKSGKFVIKEYEENLPNGHKHKIFVFKKPLEFEKGINQMIVPKDYYFLLGDNRDNAFDSRYVGVVHRDEIKGKVIYGIWGETKERINYNYRDK